MPTEWEELEGRQWPQAEGQLLWKGKNFDFISQNNFFGRYRHFKSNLYVLAFMRRTRPPFLSPPLPPLSRSSDRGPPLTMTLILFLSILRLGGYRRRVGVTTAIPSLAAGVIGVGASAASRLWDGATREETRIDAGALSMRLEAMTLCRVSPFWMMISIASTASEAEDESFAASVSASHVVHASRSTGVRGTTLRSHTPSTRTPMSTTLNSIEPSTN